MKTFLNSGNIKAAKQVKKAFESDGVLHGVRVTRCYLDRPQQSPKLKWEGVISINNVKNRDHGMRVWRANGIGKKNLFRGATLKILKTLHYSTSLWLKTPCIPSNVLAPPRHEKPQKKATLLQT